MSENKPYRGSKMPCPANLVRHAALHCTSGYFVRQEVFVEACVKKSCMRGEEQNARCMNLRTDSCTLALVS
jgi:hypothetical protein